MAAGLSLHALPGKEPPDGVWYSRVSYYGLQSQVIARRTGLQGGTCKVGVLFTPKASANVLFALEISLGASYAAASVLADPV